MREQQDSQLQVSGLLPNAGNTVNTNVIDLGQTSPYPVTEQVAVRITSTVATGANNKNINIRVMHSHEAAANFINVAELANPLLRVTDANGAGFPAGEANAYLPPTTRRYLKFAALGEANGGNAGDGTFTVKLLF
jgi:hypothetical protein